MGLVCFAFGAAAVPFGGKLPGGQLSGRALIQLLAELGVSEAASRSLLLRMRKEGWLESERSGREARYRLAPAIDAAQARIERQLRGHRPDWKGYFNGVLYEIPEPARPFLGYATLRPGLLVATTDRWAELTALLPGQPSGSQVLQVQVRLGEADSRLVAARLWALDALAGQYRSVLAEARERTDRAEQYPPGPAAFRAFAAATLPIFDASAADPDLPAELLPADWPGDQLGAALARAYRAFFPGIGAYLTALTR
jgi:phenylacetic acid degradation operon negative regulatory protein